MTAKPDPAVDEVLGDWVECWDCGGEGTVYDCFEEYACLDPEAGCGLCGRRCSVCRGKGGWEYEPEDGSQTRPTSDGEAALLRPTKGPGHE